MPIRVRDLVVAAEATGRISADDFRRWAQVRGRRNIHLADASETEAEFGYSERSDPLPMDAEVYGDFLTVDCCRDSSWVCLEDHESLVSVERAILSPSGVLNASTTFILAFVDGQCRKYEVRDRAGRLLAKDGSSVTGPTPEVRLDPAKCRVIWE